MHITIGVPSRGRTEKLAGCLESIVATCPEGLLEEWVSVAVYADACEETHRLAEGSQAVQYVLWSPEQKGAVYGWNELAGWARDAFMYVCDDVLFQELCLQNIRAHMERKFPDGDGIAGLNIVNEPRSMKGAMGLIGAKYLLRFPDKKFLYPGYWGMHQDAELVEAAGRMDRFSWCEPARIVHLHPGHVHLGRRIPPDQTHFTHRSRHADDRSLRFARKRLGYSWGNVK